MARGVIERLAYVLRAETEGLAGDLKGAENQLTKFTNFVERNPLAAMGALGAAMLTVATQATKMAAEVERSMHRVARVVPGAAQQMGQLREEIEALSKSTPRSQADLARAAEEIARQGVESIDGLQQRLQAAVRAADASGADLTTIIGGLDQTLDLFGKSSAEADGLLGKLFATAKGRMPLEDLFGALQAATPTIRAFNLDFDTSVRAIGALLEQGRTAKQAGAELKAYAELGAEGAAAIRALAASHTIATGALQEYEVAIRQSRDTTEAAWQITKNNFAAVMIDLGQKILPIVNAELRGLVGLMEMVGQTGERIERPAHLNTLRTGRGRGTNNAQFRTAVVALQDAASRGELDFSGASLDDLARMQFALEKFKRETGASTQAWSDLARAISNAQVAASKLALAKPAASAGGGGTTVRSPDQIKADQDFAKRLRSMTEGVAEHLDKAGVLGEKEKSEIRSRLEAFAIELTATMVDDIRQQFEAEIKAATAAGFPEIADAYRTAMGDALRNQDRTEQVDVGLAVTKDMLPIDRMRTLMTLQRELTKDAEKLPKFSKERLAAEKEIAKVEGEISELQDETAEHVQEITIADKARVEAMLQLVAGALNLAAALGLGDGKLASMATHAANMADNWEKAFSGDWNLSRIGSLMGVIGSAAQLFKSAFGGKSPQQIQQEKENASSARAVDRLVEKLGDLLGSGLSGSEFSRIRAASADFQALLPRDWQHGSERRRNAGNAAAFFEARGIPFADVERLAKSLGVTLNGTAQGFYELDRALKLADFAAYLGSFAGQLQLLQDRFEVFGIEDSVERYRKTLELLMDPEIGAPALFGLLSGIDLGSADGAASARAVLQDLFERAARGDLTPEQLGGLSPQQFIETVKSLLGLLGAPGGAGALGGANAGAVSGLRSLTEATGSQLADYARAELQAVQDILALLRAWVMPSLVPPSASFTSPTGAFASQAPLHIEVRITVNQYGTGDRAGVEAAAFEGSRLGVEEALTASGLIRAQRVRGDLRIVS